MLKLHHGYWADHDGLILAVAQAPDHILIRVIRTERTPQGPRPVFFRSEHDLDDFDGAKNIAREQAETILGRKVPADLKWREYQDLGLLVKLL